PSRGTQADAVVAARSRGGKITVRRTFECSNPCLAETSRRKLVPSRSVLLGSYNKLICKCRLLDERQDLHKRAIPAVGIALIRIARGVVVGRKSSIRVVVIVKCQPQLLHIIGT